MGRKSPKKDLTRQIKSPPNQTLLDALARGALARRKLAVAEGGSLSTAQAARLLGVTKGTLLRQWRQHHVIGWKDGNMAGFLRWQFLRHKMLPGTRELLNGFRSHDHWRVMLYFLSRRHSLRGQRPLDLLRNGEVDRLLQRALADLPDNEW